eukprot:SAG25_NODE_11170_length_311_cov_1.933962_2_plen_66_part_01
MLGPVMCACIAAANERAARPRAAAAGFGPRSATITPPSGTAFQSGSQRLRRQRLSQSDFPPTLEAF